MQIDILLNKFFALTDELNEKQKDYIHFNSFKNFIVNINELKDFNQIRVQHLLEQYIFFIEENKAEINIEFSFMLVSNYLEVIGKIYKDEAAFIYLIRIKYALFTVILIDIILILTKLTIFFNIPLPVVSLATVLYYLIIIRPKINSGKAYGIYY